MTLLLSTFLVLGVAAIALKLLFPLPARENFPEDLPVPAASTSFPALREMAEAGGEGESYVMLLDTGLLAISGRLALIRRAQGTIDAQYYIWEGDLAGRVMLEEIIAAADRGVRVRLLIDDNPTAGLDAMWAAVNSHPNIAVRIFNPLTIRAARPLNYLFDFPRLNRRMHNKSLTVDGMVTVVGGRNVGDVYFGAGDANLFIDIDALALGAIVPEVSREFETYWNSEPAYPAELILARAPMGAIEEYRTLHHVDTAKAEGYRKAANELIQTLTTQPAEDLLTTSTIDLLSDNPDKALGKVRHEDLLVEQIARIVGKSTKSLDLVSGYFVPGDRGLDILVGLARKGVATRVVTNGYAVTDVPMVHAGYYPSRVPLLRAGVRLYEAKRQGEEKTNARDFATTRFSGGGESVHAKTFAVDGKELFVGSFNIDPRSAVLNCEMGFLIHSPALAGRLKQALDRNLAEKTYAVSLNDAGETVWTTQHDGRPLSTTTEPDTTAVSRMLVWILSKLPIRWLL
ncbi:phospholipase D family protein [Croceibacterium salegens]|nr:phospholipase D family protein [Croceibacterium salegens]